MVRISSTPRSKASSLVSQVAPSSQGDDRDPSGPGPVLLETLNELSLAYVHIDDSKMRLPLPENRRGLPPVGRNASRAGAVVECQLDDSRERRLIYHE